MKANFEELDEKTREFMLEEFEAEQNSGNPFTSQLLSDIGGKVFPGLMKKAIVSEDEEFLSISLSKQEYWKEKQEYTRDGITREKRVNINQAAERLGFSEFNTWYVRGLAKKLIAEGVERCQVYRAKEAKWEPGECSKHEGQVMDVRIIYEGHRAKYWPEKNDSAFSIPAQPGCHHTIRRVK
ncbi:hypothetical protein KAV79_04255 [Candidatus Aerophobetes bacterium]|nr:hypothetical protein [Candidatus Aerophobetes bacterium]